MPVLSSAMYPKETEDHWTREPYTRAVVGSSSEKPDFSLVLLPESETVCFGGIPTDPVVEPSNTVRALGLDRVPLPPIPSPRVAANSPWPEGLCCVFGLSQPEGRGDPDRVCLLP